MSAPPPDGAGSSAPEAGPAARRPRPRLHSRRQQERRQVIRGGALTLALLVLQPLAGIPLARRLRDRLRPPGALAEEAFLGSCIKCGQCVQVCPVQAIALADAGDGFGVGAPFIDAREQACDFSCDALSCILACPTGALSHALKQKEEVRAGLARVARPELCLARRGEPLRGDLHGDLPYVWRSLVPRSLPRTLPQK